MIKDEKRELWKAHDHLIRLCRTVQRLESEPMSVKQFAYTLSQLSKDATLASRRVGQMIGREVSLADRMELSNETSD